MKRLFVLRHGKRGDVVRDIHGEVMYFGNKQDAKMSRQDGQVVSTGPDHKLFKGI
jgi:hypothetical protein